MISAWLEPLQTLIALLQQWVFESMVQPLVFALGATRWQEEAYDATEWLVIGVIEIVLLWLVLGTLQRLWPAEPMRDRAAVRTDVLYTALKRLGVIPVLIFLLLTPIFDTLEGWLRLAGFSRLNLEALVPALDGRPLAAFLVYLVVLDFAEYWIHRGQHSIGWWWDLHAVHHSQQQMTFWSDERSHLLEDVIRDGLLALLAIAIGVAPAQFMGLVIVSRVLQSLQHANLRWRFGAIGERLLVSPSFHRRHHAIGVGHEGTRHGCNFAVLFPIWDVIFRSADFQPGFIPTGIRDQLEGRDYGRGFWSQQWRALLRWGGRA